jgi:hypothetical protein
VSDWLKRVKDVQRQLDAKARGQKCARLRVEFFEDAGRHAWQCSECFVRFEPKQEPSP